MNTFIVQDHIKNKPSIKVDAHLQDVRRSGSKKGSRLGHRYLFTIAKLNFVLVAVCLTDI